MATYQYKMTNGGKVIEQTSLTAAATSEVINLNPRHTAMGVQCIVTNNTDLVGSVEVQLSNDGETWQDATFSDDSTSITVASATNATDLRSIALSGFRFARVTFTHTSSTTGGDLTVNVSFSKG